MIRGIVIDLVGNQLSEERRPFLSSFCGSRDAITRSIVAREALEALEALEEASRPSMLVQSVKFS